MTNKMRGGKPAIYLYDKMGRTYSVKIGLRQGEWALDTTLPKPSLRTEDDLVAQWDHVRPLSINNSDNTSSKLSVGASGEECDYLFWDALTEFEAHEAWTQRFLHGHDNATAADGTTRTTCTAATDTGKAEAQEQLYYIDCDARSDKEWQNMVRSALELRGLCAAEMDEFMEYWIPYMRPQHKVGDQWKLVFRFLDVETHGKLAKLTVEPAVDLTLRVFLLFAVVSADADEASNNI